MVPPLQCSSRPAAAPASFGLKDWLAWQEELHSPKVELGLARCCTVAARLDLLRPAYTVITVAGTNGKGSSVAMLETVLHRAGYATGAYYSPHLLRYNERIRIDGVEVGDAELCRAFEAVNEARGEIPLTYFEFGTLAALLLFRQAAPRVVILEVGLGGRLDAVNLLDADLALVTAVALDHQHWLGPDRESIGREKAGIFRAGRPAVCSDPAPPQSLLRHAAELGCELFRSGREYRLDNSRAHSWNWHGPGGRHLELPLPDPLNPCQVQNAGGVLMALHHLREQLPVGEDALREGLREARFPGRFQVVPGPLCYILDVAHNRQAALQLYRNLEALPRTGAQHLLLGMLADKDYAAVLEILVPAADSCHLVDLPPPRGAPAECLAAAWNGAAAMRQTPPHCHADIREAWEAVHRDAQEGDRIVVCGSFLTVGGVLEHCPDAECGRW